MKKIMLGLILLACVFGTLFCIRFNTAAKTETGSKTKTESKKETDSKKETVPQTETGMKEKTDAVPSATPSSENKETSSSSPEVHSSVFTRVFGEWLITEVTGSGYISSTSYPDEDYIGGKLIIRDDFVQCSLPNEEWNYTIKNPKFVMQWKSRDDFFMGRYAQYDSFGFEDEEKVPLIEIKKKKHEDYFADTIWIKDEDHIVIEGPSYYLAERQKG